MRYTKICCMAAILGFGYALVAAQNPQETADNAWITLSGSVKEVQPDRFTLDYGAGEVVVEMDDQDRDADRYKLSKGEKVTVNGKIDRDLYESTKIEAHSVHVERAGTTFYASPLDDEEPNYYTYHPGAASGQYPSTTVFGMVSEVHEGKGEFIIKTGPVTLTVDTSGVKENPLDDKGYLRLEKGDRVAASGTMTSDFFDRRQLNASNITKISPGLTERPGKDRQRGE